MSNHQNPGNFDGKYCTFVGKWKEKLEIYLKATGASEKPDEMKVGLLLNHMCDSCLKIYSNFSWVWRSCGRRSEIAGPKSWEVLNCVSKVRCTLPEMGTSTDITREILALSSRRADTNLRFVCYQHERKAIFPVSFYEQACKEDSYKLKIYDQEATLSLEIPVKILSLGEAAKRELQESKTGEIGSVTERGSKPNPRTMNNPQSDSRGRSFQPSTRNCR